MAQTFYERMRDVAQRLTTKYKTGTVTIRKYTTPVVGSSAVWTQDLQDARAFTQYTLDTVVIGVSAEYVKDTTVTMDDLMAITSPMVKDVDGMQVGPIEFVMDDEFRIDGNIHRIKKIERIPSAGLASGFIIYVCS